MLLWCCHGNHWVTFRNCILHRKKNDKRNGEKLKGKFLFLWVAISIERAKPYQVGSSGTIRKTSICNEIPRAKLDTWAVKCITWLGTGTVHYNSASTKVSHLLQLHPSKTASQRVTKNRKSCSQWWHSSLPKHNHVFFPTAPSNRKLPAYLKVATIQQGSIHFLFVEYGLRKWVFFVLDVG